MTENNKAAAPANGHPRETPSSETPSLETPSGKSAETENFPVGSRLIAAHLRPHVGRFYAFARAIDDIADNPDLAPEDKCARLDIFAATVMGEALDEAPLTARRLHESLEETGVSVRHCLDLISAFKQDAVQNRYESFDDLIDYCNRSAAPVGRYLLDLHGEDQAFWPISDALCNSLQIINHLQDCGDDYHQMNRIYLPQSDLREAGAVDTDLGRAKTSPALRAVIDRLIESVHELNDQAARLPKALQSRRLAAESAVIHNIARSLTTELARRDPLAERIKLSRWQIAMAAGGGLLSTLVSRPEKPLPKKPRS
ncbi:putative protein [alpha proteobacterium Q-1]|nr:putative protein [alpha proteobacterium Q-1]